MNPQNRQSGQIGVVVLLIMTAMLTIGIGAVSRSTQDLRLTRQEAESTSAFNVAEAGIERALAEITVYEDALAAGDGSAVQPTAGNFLLGDYSVDYQIGTLDEIRASVLEGEVVTVHLDGNDTSVDINWGTNFSYANCDEYTAAGAMVPDIAVSIIDSTNPEVIRKAYSKCGANPGFESVNWSDPVTVSTSATTAYINVKVLGGDTDVEVTFPGLVKPVQGYRIESRASLVNSTETRVVVLERYKPGPPTILDYALVSGTGITHNIVE